MNLFEAILLGAVQGICEFLPVSSSGHLVLIQQALGISGDILFFDAMLHLGTLAAVVFVYADIIWGAIKKPFSKLPMYIVVATIPVVIVGFLCKDSIEASFEGAFLGFGFLLTALLLFLAERFSTGGKELKDMRIADPIAMGLMQCIAILPGISRSGSTIVGGLFMGVERKTAANLSFLMACPAILGAALLQFLDVYAANTIGDINWLCVVVGTMTAAVTGIFAIQFMIRVINKHALYGFATYVCVLGLFVLADQYFLHWIF